MQRLVFSVKKWLRGEKTAGFLISIFFLLFYLYFQTTTIYGGDAGDLVTAAYVHGVAHPPGYPVYTLLSWWLTQIPYSTIAWRVGLLSSIPASVTLGMLFIIFRYISKSSMASLISVLVFGFSYLFWLYAIIPEVFSLYVLLVVIFVWLAIKFTGQSQNRQRQLFILSFLTGLSLTHHHTIIFLLPAILYFIYPHFKKILTQVTNSFYLKLLGFFILGFLPYIYVVIAAYTNPPINWENPRNIIGLIRLVSRALYGSFRSNTVFVAGINQRFSQIKFFFDSFAIDFTRLGVILAFIGVIYLYKHQRKLCKFSLLAFTLSGPVYLFYAGFPAFTSFHFGTIERFLLVPYIFFMIWLLMGLKVTGDFFNSLINHFIVNIKINASLAFMVLPIFLLWSNYPKLLSLKNDRTAENLGIDTLQSVPDNSLIFIDGDTAYFNTTYVYYVYEPELKLNNKVIISSALLEQQFYRQIINYQYPAVNIPNNYNTIENPLLSFVEANANRYAIFSAKKIYLDEKFFWLPHGLLFKLYQTEKIPYSDIKTTNENLFAQYHQPLSGALGQYNHLILSDVSNVYADGFREFGKILLIGQDFELAETYFLKSKQLQPGLIDNTLGLIKAYLGQNKCPEAKSEIDRLIDKEMFIDELEKVQTYHKNTCDQ